MLLLNNASQTLFFLLFRTTIFVSFTNTWYDQKTQSEVTNLLLFSHLEKALGTSGLAGLDTLFAFMLATELTVSKRFVVLLL